MLLIEIIVPLLATGLGLLSTGLIFRVVGIECATEGRFSSIDGLRGFLAFFVFIHHASTWGQFTETGVWRPPSSHLFVHMGHSSVSMFFMITGFLFFTKLINSTGQSFDWRRFFIARFLRLTPLYLLAMAIMLALVVSSTGWRLNVPLSDLLHQLGSWLAFTVPGSPDINGFNHTNVITSKVTWSLVYEWLFYFSLPFLGLLFRVKASLTILSVSAAVLAWMLWSMESVIFPSSFLGGLLAAVAVRSDTFCRLARSSAGTVVLLVSLVALVCIFPTGHGVKPLSLVAVAFMLIAAGNDVWGVLTSRVSRMMGELAYGIYVLHGAWLYILFKHIAPASASPGVQWAYALCGIPGLILLCALGHRFIEKPGMAATPKVLRLLDARKAGPRR